MRRESGRERGRGRERWREKQSGWEKGERKADGRTMHNADFLEENPTKKPVVSNLPNRFASPSFETWETWKCSSPHSSPPSLTSRVQTGNLPPVWSLLAAPVHLFFAAFDIPESTTLIFLSHTPPNSGLTLLRLPLVVSIARISHRQCGGGGLPLD